QLVAAHRDHPSCHATPTSLTQTEERDISIGEASDGFTDPPYNVRIEGHASGLGAVHHRPFPMASGEMDGAQFTAFLGEAFRNLASFSSDGSLHYVCMDWRHVEE